MSKRAKSEALIKLLDSTVVVEAVNSILSNSQLVEKLKQVLLASEDEQSVSIFRCDKCEYGSHSYAELVQHIRWHNDDNSCPLCDYRGSTQIDWGRHMVYHSESLKYKCTQCPYMACTQTLLYEHTRIVHNTLYSHSCDLCAYESNGELMRQHKAACHNDASKLKSTPSKRRSGKSRQLTEKENKKAGSSMESAPILPKEEPTDVCATMHSPIDSTNHPVDLLQQNTTPAMRKNVARYTRTPVDRRPWWDTKTQILPPHIADVVEKPKDKDSSQCAACGDYYTGEASSHQCAVVKPTLTSSTHMCCLCDFYTGGRKALIDHYIAQHSRVWNSLVLRLSHSYPSLEYLCDAVEAFVPGRYKRSADNIWVRRTNDDEILHNVSSPGVALYRCTKCFKSFPSLDLQAGHKLLDECEEAVLRYQFGCAVCKIELATSDEGLTHHLQHHTTMNGVKAEEVNNSATKDALLMVEALQKVGAEDRTACGPSMVQAKVVAAGYQMCCHLCPYITDNNEKYMEHLSVNHWTGTGQPTSASVTEATYCTLFGCNLCTYVCEDIDSLSTHLTGHAGVSRKSNKNKSAQRNANHSGSNINSSVEPSSEAIATSADLPTGDVEEGSLLLCTVCGFQTNNKSSLRSHSLRHLKNRLQCEQCNFSTTHTSTLTIHMRSHTGYRPFVCSMCGKGFTTNSELRKHERRHAGLVERKFSCDVCGKTYSTPQHLKVHMRLHTGDRPFKCSLCTFAATSKCVLVNHISTHTGEKNYKCHLCDFACASSGTLSNHRRLKHNIVNKRKTLAETTPESILIAAKVAGKSKRVKSGSGSVTASATAALSKEAQLNLNVPVLPDRIGTNRESEKELSALDKVYNSSLTAQQTVTTSTATVQVPNIIDATSSVQPQLPAHIPVYHIIQTGSADYQMVGEVHTNVTQT